MKASEMLIGRRGHHVGLLANALGVAFEPLGAELRLIDVGDFIAFIHDEKFANIQDIVNSSVELFFKPGTVSFGWGAQFNLDWSSLPVITLDMEFRHGSVWLVFKLVLRALQTDVKIDYFSPGGALGDSRQEAAMLIEAITDARLNLREH
ncbi:MAG TPA: hypothetical protein VLZ74_01420 [Methylocella sp.]|nr:hypothetical protein [Methylocella sp.]